MEYFLSFLSACVAFFTGVIVSDNINIKRKKYTIQTDKKVKDTRFVFLSDLHGHEFGNGNIELINKIKASNPDYILVGGDLITCKFSLSMDAVFTLLSKLCKEYKVYYCMGNHEDRLRWSRDRYGDKYDVLVGKIQEAGAVIVDNDFLYIDDTGIKLSGLCLEEKYYRKTSKIPLDVKHVDELIKNNNDDSYHIMLAHDPEYYDVYAKSEIDLVLSGHVHGGVMRLPKGYGAIDPRFKLFNPLSWGTRLLNKTRIIISAGLAMHTIPIRVFNPAELTVIDIKGGRE